MCLHKSNVQLLTLPHLTESLFVIVLPHVTNMELNKSELIQTTNFCAKLQDSDQKHSQVETRFQVA